MVFETVRQSCFVVCVVLGLGFVWSGWSQSADIYGSLRQVRFRQTPEGRNIDAAFAPYSPDVSPEAAIAHYPTLSVVEQIRGGITLATGVLWFILAILIQRLHLRSSSVP